MTLDNFTALILFSFVASITPGPNNIMLMASGANFGFKRTLPHMLGVALGFVFLFLVIGAGLANLFERLPKMYYVLKIIGICYLLFLAWKIATAASIEQGNARAKPFTFFQAALFQWVNPKVWVMSITSISVYAPEQTLHQITFVALVFGIVNIPSLTTWVVAGQQLRRWLSNPKRLRKFNIVMALLLVASLYPVLKPIA